MLQRRASPLPLTEWKDLASRHGRFTASACGHEICHGSVDVLQGGSTARPLWRMLRQGAHGPGLYGAGMLAVIAFVRRSVSTHDILSAISALRSCRSLSPHLRS